jgi:hypothetical protein
LIDPSDAKMLMDGTCAQRHLEAFSMTEVEKKKAMPLSDNSLSIIKARSAMMLSLMFASLISPAEAQTVPATCGPTSPQCCTVVRIRQLIGKATTVSSTNATACCYTLGTKTQSSGIWGVNCTSDGTVTQIVWWRTLLTGSIPPEIGNLVNLTLL